MPATAAKKKAGKAPEEVERREGELFLIDGNSLAYRAFFALPESIATADGRPTNAIYVIASLARHAREAEIPVMIVSGDRDVYQLVTEGVRVMTTSRGVTDTRIYDREGVIERYGVPPELVPDLIGLKGDTSDNIPGVPGIGDKTAAELLQQFGSLEAVLESVDQISGAKRKQNLTEHADDARISKQLATLKDDIDVPIDVSEIVRSTPDRSRLREFAAEFELRAV